MSYRSSSAPLVLVAALLGACASEPRFPPGGPIRASGSCGVHFSPPDAEPAPDDGYRYDMDLGTGIELFFEDGTLVRAKLEDKVEPLFDYRGARPRRYPDPGPVQVEAGDLRIPMVEGRWHDVAVEQWKLRLRFVGSRLEVALRDRIEAAECAWR